MGIHKLFTVCSQFVHKLCKLHKNKNSGGLRIGTSADRRSNYEQFVNFVKEL